MLSLYEILRASKTGIAPDMRTALAGMNWGGADSGHEVKELTGIPPLTFRADGTPLLDYLISGNMSQTGTPTPTTPIQPQETGDRTGNLFDGTKYEKTSILSTEFWEYATTLTGSVYCVPCKPNTTYTLYLTENINITIWRIRCVSTNAVPNAQSTRVPLSGSYANSVPASKSTTFTTSSDAKYILFQTNEAAYADVLPVIMLVEGITKIPYEPYGYKIPFSSANTTTPVYLGEVETTRRIKKLVLTGEENWSKDSDSRQSARYYISVSDIESSTTNLLSSHFTQSTQYEIGTMRGYRKTVIFSVDKNIYDTVADFKAWLAAQYAAGTPVTVWYVLATEETGIVNEPLMKIGDYADEVSNVATIPTNNGSNTFDVDTTVKPSEVYIKYKGV